MGNKRCVDRKPWNKGLKEQLNTGRTCFKKGFTPWNKGKAGTYKFSEEAKKRMSDSQKRIGNKPPIMHRKGKDNPNWKNGSGNINKLVKERDGGICQICGLKEPEIMEIDHILPKSRFIDKKYELNNLITLCPNCHKRKTKKDAEKYNFYKKNVLDNRTK